MRKLILKMSVSLDGFVGGPNGEVEWIFKSADQQTTAWIVETLWQAGVHIMGSRTYYDMAAYWPTSNEPFAAPMNEIPKVVFSRSGALQAPNPSLTTTAFKEASRTRMSKGTQAADKTVEMQKSWLEAEVASGELGEEIARLKRRPGKDILAHGGASFARSLVEQRLVDEYRLLIHPVALGKGLPLFSALNRPLELKLVNTTAFPAGIVAQIYRPA